MIWFPTAWTLFIVFVFIKLNTSFPTNVKNGIFIRRRRLLFIFVLDVNYMGICGLNFAPN